jgi:signal transduction histidine kinase
MAASYEGGSGGETPCEGSFSVPIEWRRIIRQGDSRRCPRRYPRRVFMSSTATAPRRFAARPTPAALLDVAVAAAALAGSLALLRHGGIDALRPGSGTGAADPGAGKLDLVGVALAASSTVPLVAWRRSPLVVFTLTSAASVLLAGLGYRIDLLLGPTVALYLLAASREPQAPWTRRTTAAVAGLLVAYLVAAAAAQGAFPASELLHTGLAWAAAWFAGERARLRREQVAELKQRALRAEREAERERQLAVAEERARIARDLHDSAGHAISVIAVRAGAARLRHHQDPDRSLAALEAIEGLARQTAGEIDQLVGTLREGGSAGRAVEAPPGLASLDTLIARHRAAGLRVALDTSGAPRPLGAAADQAAYRILQEALTNAARHGTGSARVELAFGDAAVELRVTNPVPARGAPRSGGGHGLVGMRERATLLGGDLDAERANGAFRLQARIPYGAQRP